MPRLLYPSKVLGDWIEVDVGAISDDYGRRFTPKDIEEHIKIVATVDQTGHVKLNDTLTSTSKNEAATADALRRVSEKVDKTTPPDATTSRKGIVQLNNSLTSTSSTQAATPYAVKQVNDKLTDNKVGIGSGSYVADDGGIAIGMSAKARQGEGIAIGKNAVATRGRSISLGENAEATASANGIAIGNKSYVDALGSIALGIEAQSHTPYAIAIGYGAKIIRSSGVAIGYASECTNSGAVAIGERSKCLNEKEGVLGGEDYYSVNWRIPGNFSVQGTKNFEVPHPRPEKRDTHVIRHGAVESPTPGDTLYRYFVKFKDKIAQIALCGSDSLIEAFTAPLGGGGKS